MENEVASQLLANYHTHTPRCMHAVGSEEEYAASAYKEGYRILGFSDHAPFPFRFGYVSGMRMTVEQLPEYVDAVDKVRKKWDGKMKIYTGLECEYFPRYDEYIRSLRDKGIQYFILGQHFLDSEEDSKYSACKDIRNDTCLRYADALTKGMTSGVYTYVAHPDLYMRYFTSEQFGKRQMEAADVICQCALECHLPLEYNLLGRLEGLGYPCDAFWRYIKKWNVPVIIGVDAHEPSHFANWDNRLGGEELLEDCGITPIRSVEIKE